MASGLIAGTGTTNTAYLHPYIWWQSTADPANNRSILDVRVIVDQTGNRQITWSAIVSGIFIQIGDSTETYANYRSLTTDGWTYSAAQSPTGNRAELICQRLSVAIPHEADGTKSIVLDAGFVLPGDYGTGTVTFPATTVTLDPISVKPGAVSNLSASLGKTGVSLSWSAASGTVTGYKVERQTRTVDGTAGAWASITTTSGTSYLDNVRGAGLLAGQSVKYRVCALNGAIEGDATETAFVFLGGGLYLNDSGAWKFGQAYVRQSGTWVPAQGVYSYGSGTWKQSKTALEKG